MEITIAGSHGHFELNVFKPLIIYNILQSIYIMADSQKLCEILCCRLKADKERIKELLDNSLMLVTALAPKLDMTMQQRLQNQHLKIKQN